MHTQTHIRRILLISAGKHKYPFHVCRLSNNVSHRVNHIVHSFRFVRSFRSIVSNSGTTYLYTHVHKENFLQWLVLVFNWVNFRFSISVCGCVARELSDFVCENPIMHAHNNKIRRISSIIIIIMNINIIVECFARIHSILRWNFRCHNHEMWATLCGIVERGTKKRSFA